MGGRLLKWWLGQPLLDMAQLDQRLDAVEWFQGRLGQRTKAIALELSGRGEEARKVVRDLMQVSPSFTLSRYRSEHPAAWMIWEGEPLPESVKRLEGMGIGSVVFDPCGNRPDQGDFLTVMKRNVENLRSVFRKGS